MSDPGDEVGERPAPGSSTRPAADPPPGVPGAPGGDAEDVRSAVRRPGGAGASVVATEVAASASRLQRLAADRAGRRARRRQRRARRMTALTALAAAVTVLPLVSILLFLVVRGLAALGPTLAPTGSAVTPAAGTAAGFGGAVAGSLVLLAIACGLGLPVGLGAGLWLAERRGRRRAALVRYLADVLLGVPSIVFGIVAWQLLVRPVGHFSAWAGGVALAAMIVPLVARTADDVLAQVPTALTEAALALGYPRWRTALGVVLRAALPGVVTGALVAVARVAGETAPLLFTAFGNQFWSVHPGRPIAALPLRIYTSALSGSPAQRAQGYAGALVLVAGVAVFGLVARRATRDRLTPATRLGAGPLTRPPDERHGGVPLA